MSGVESKLRTRQERIEIIELLGEGLNSRVFKAFLKHPGFLPSQVVALKVFKSQRDILVFKKEFQDIVKVRSRYCGGLLGWSMVDNEVALIMDHIEGITLSELLQSPIDTILVGEIIAQIHNGLRELHGYGIPHGDLNLGNVMVDTNGQIKIIDFGLWKGQKKGETLGSPAFMSKERFEAGEVTVESDFFALKMIHHYLSMGRAPKFKVVEEARKYVDYVNDVMVSSVDPCRETPEARVRLAQLVRESHHRRKVNQPSTLRIPRVKPQNFWVRTSASLLLASFLLFPQVSVSRLPSSLESMIGTAGYIEIRTRDWFKIEINGQDLGYAPLKTNMLKPGVYTVKWSNSKRSGYKLVTLLDGESIRLTDVDLL